ncbi:MAG: DUF1385 domain-containing protein [Dehalococcoidales bacterium]|nr:DUF1385 domain-containing protein [Dehalococcoidales bacterium]MDP7524747.1 DUF1385 domain-containing protein [Dehalococcoidales bacterium]
MADRFYYGGQAVVDGVMMRGQKTAVTAVRRPDGGLAIDTQYLSGIYTGRLRKAPLVRGAIVLIEAMVLGIKALLFSANVSLEDEGEEISGGMLWLTVIGALVFTVGLFFMLPLFLTRLLNIGSSLVFNLVDGLIRVTILIIYLRAMALLPDIRRTFAYHGAEHTVVNAYENGVPLKLEAVKGFSKAHVRCGTSFIFVVIIISIFVFGIFGLRPVWQMVLSRLVLIPIIAAISYEAIYFGARHTGNRLVRAMLAPGLWLQSLTTREPDSGQLEVAIAALTNVVEAGEGETGGTEETRPAGETGPAEDIQPSP